MAQGGRADALVNGGNVSVFPLDRSPQLLGRALIVGSGGGDGRLGGLRLGSAIARVTQSGGHG